MASEIDWEALEAVQQEHEHWRLEHAPELSPRYVQGEGDNPEAFIIGEAPGSDEDVQLRPFVGPAGQVLRQLIALAELWAHPKDSLHGTVNSWLTNVVKFRPPGNRTPSERMIHSIRRTLFTEWKAIGAPSLIIPVGKIALAAVTGNHRMSILRVAGKCHKYTSREGQELDIWPMVHPSYGMRSRNEQLQEVLEQDWIRLGAWRNGT